ncbi:MAG: HAD family phosphatase [Cytophagaceae bacterium]|nr:HAD family phosphatase [Cytophagaceae bacterium]MDW8455781.1 HAD family phosphatase [Cytophagaceae bacterium]
MQTFSIDLNYSKKRYFYNWIYYNMNFSSIRNIVFDMGDVIINIDPMLTYKAFAEIARTDTETMHAQFRENEIFKMYEVGKLSDKEFRNTIRDMLRMNLSDETIDNAWNSMLLDVPAERIELLLRLRTKYNIYLLSNTNAIHTAEVIKRIAQWTPITDYHQLFHRAYLSHQIGFIKPDPAVYRLVMEDAALRTENSIFLDDNLENVKSANDAGLPAIQVTKQNPVTNILKDA